MLLPNPLAALLLVFFGAGLLGVGWAGWRSGALPMGTAGQVRRDERPLAYALMLLLYLCAGMALAVWGLLLALGMAPPLRLR